MDKEKAEAFIHLLTNAATIENGRVIILFAMRSDFVSNCATYPQLNELLNQQFMQVGAMQPDELVSAKRVRNPRPESEALVETTLPPEALLADLRAHSDRPPSLGVPSGPNSGLSVRLP